MLSLGNTDRVEACVFECGCACRLDHRSVDRTDGQNVSDTTSQFAPQIQGSKSPTRFGEMMRGRFQRNLAMLERGKNRVMREQEQLLALVLREFTWGRRRRGFGRTMSRLRHRGRPAWAEQASCAG